MTAKYEKHLDPDNTPQSEPLEGQEQNYAGGYSYVVDKWTHLDRFLILGTEGGTYYATERHLTIENVKNVLECVKEDGVRVVDRVLEISKEGRAPKNDPALFVLALCASQLTGQDTPRDRKKREQYEQIERVVQRAFEVLPQVARTGSHLFLFMAYCKALRGKGPALRKALRKWYKDKDVVAAAYQMVKYQNRYGWTHRDLLRIARPVPEGHQSLFYYVTKGEMEPDGKDSVSAPELVYAKELLAKADNERQVLTLIADFTPPWEVIPTEWLKSAAVWEALLPDMPLMAMTRNLGRMTSIGLLGANSDSTKMVCERYTEEAIKKARLHPIAILLALKTYAQGAGLRGSLTWRPNSRIVDKLDDAFYDAIGNVIPIGKRVMMACDVSSSMGGFWGGLAGTPLTPAEGCGALALITARVENQYHIVGYERTARPLDISPKMRLDKVLQVMSFIGGGTDCVSPVRYALKKKIPVDAITIWTDSETWAGEKHMGPALREYRRKMGINTKLVCNGMTATEFSIADPNDSGMMDVVGFDVATPNLISDFCRGT